MRTFRNLLVETKSVIFLSLRTIVYGRHLKLTDKLVDRMRQVNDDELKEIFLSQLQASSVRIMKLGLERCRSVMTFGLQEYSESRNDMS